MRLIGLLLTSLGSFMALGYALNLDLSGCIVGVIVLLLGFVFHALSHRRNLSHVKNLNQ